MPSLREWLATEADAVSAFVFLLREEQEALTSGNADVLPGIVGKKATASAHLASISAARNAELASQGYASDKAGMVNWLARHAQDQSTEAAWKRLQELAAEARELNRLNGELIHLRMSHNAQMLEVLLAANRQDLYGADGQTSATTTRRIIDSA